MWAECSVCVCVSADVTVQDVCMGDVSENIERESEGKTGRELSCIHNASKSGALRLTERVQVIKYLQLSHIFVLHTDSDSLGTVIQCECLYCIHVSINQSTIYLLYNIYIVLKFFKKHHNPTISCDEIKKAAWSLNQCI